MAYLPEQPERTSQHYSYIREPGPTEIREIAWIPLENLSDDEKAEFQNAIN